MRVNMVFWLAVYAVIAGCVTASFGPRLAKDTRAKALHMSQSETMWWAVFIGWIWPLILAIVLAKLVVLLPGIVALWIRKRIFASHEAQS